MHLVCIFPIANNLGKQPLIVEAFRDIGKKLNALGVQQLELKFAGINYVYVPNSESLVGQTKGEGILEVLKSLHPDVDYVIMCDGSGKIPYDKIVEVFSELVSDPSSKCVMAERVGDNKAISKIRHLIERWEVYLLKRFFNHPKDIVDGQCGLWGYYLKEIKNGDYARKIKLTAKGYDIELDLLSEVLEKNIGYSFLPIELTIPLEKIKTAYKSEDNLRKMRFLLEKYPVLKGRIESSLLEYEKTTPKNFTELPKDELEVWGNYCSEIKKL